MATYDEIGEFNIDQVLSKRFTTPGGSVAPTIAPELFPVITMENDRVEWGYNKGERRCSRFFILGGVAAEYRSLQLYLPSDSRNIAVVTNIKSVVSNDTRIARLVGIGGSVAPWSAQSVAVADFRWNGERTSLIAETISNALAPTAYPELDYLTAINSQTISPYVITPGTSLGIIAAAQASPLGVVVSWYERGAQPGELV